MTLGDLKKALDEMDEVLLNEPVSVLISDEHYIADVFVSVSTGAVIIAPQRYDDGE